jgi:hypothetical protein
MPVDEETLPMMFKVGSSKPISELKYLGQTAGVSHLE